jgi:hypothetical protein
MTARGGGPAPKSSLIRTDRYTCQQLDRARFSATGHEPHPIRYAELARRKLLIMCRDVGEQ